MHTLLSIQIISPETGVGGRPPQARGPAGGAGGLQAGQGMGGQARAAAGAYFQSLGLFLCLRRVCVCDTMDQSSITISPNKPPHMAHTPTPKKKHNTQNTQERRAIPGAVPAPFRWTITCACFFLCSV